MKIQVCKGPHCSFRGSDKVFNELEKSCANTGDTVEYCQCRDNCDYGPNVVVDDNKILDHAKPETIYQRIKDGEGKEIVPLNYDDLKLDDLL